MRDLESTSGDQSQGARDDLVSEGAVLGSALNRRPDSEKIANFISKRCVINQGILIQNSLLHGGSSELP